ncbi:hypothetical protein VC83_03080 [Pseudogymnoascus destructans]|uniref:Uncharacterized protein n=1 Tax=Pseudogymnoascus destructans TaxID=655981 RepID=A0A177AFQ4_9PEZI|nr:uncharacterized protein VC83_03080 [Pseudogymnoascus destructans]OAF59984.1 hypothetical protein VC83_03080 [Pseudogymnoascus destructans]
MPEVGAAADENGSGMPGDQVESSIAYFGNGGDYDDFPIIEELLHTKLQKVGFSVGKPGKEHIRGAVEECLGEVRSIDQSTSALSVSGEGGRQSLRFLLAEKLLCELTCKLDQGPWGPSSGSWSRLTAMWR